MTRYAYLFPGQGCQKPGMGRELSDGFAAAAAVFRRADAACDRSVSELCFSADAAELALTENTQPAILTVSVAALAALGEAGLRPAAAAGHSLGEYGAHVAAGTLSFEQAVRVVRDRGRFMQDAVPVGVGAMAAILGLAPEKVDAICAAASLGRTEVVAANYNAPTQVVVAGHAEAVERAVDGAKAEGARRAVRLDVSAPFHCPLMAPAADRLAARFAELDWTAPTLPVYANCTAAPVAGADDARTLLVRQVASPVRFVETIERMVGDGITDFVEVGPGRVLAGLVRAIDRDVRVWPAGTPEAVRKTAAELGGDPDAIRDGGNS